MTSSLRALFITLAEFGGVRKGGGERYVSELATAMEQVGVCVETALVPAYQRIALKTSLHDQARSASIRELDRAVQRADVVHVHQLNSPGFDLGAGLASRHRKPLILTDHGGGALAFGRLLGRRRLSMVAAAAFVSNWSAAEIDPLRRIPIRETVWGGGDHLPAAGPLTSRYDFGFVGRILPHKGLHVAIKALPPGASLVIAGQVRDPAYLSSLRELAEGKRVDYLLDPDDAVIASLYRSIGHLLVPSVWEYRGERFARPELLGLVALEALASGTPVIGSNVAGLGELLASANQTVVPAGDISHWTETLAHVRHRREAVLDRTRFTWGAVANRCEHIYRKSLAATI